MDLTVTKRMPLSTVEDHTIRKYIQPRPNVDTVQHVEFLAASLELYGRTTDAVTLLVGDNCAVNQCMARIIMCAPLVGCASHRFNLAVRQFLENHEFTLDSIDAVMLRCLTERECRSKLRGVPAKNPENPCKQGGDAHANAASEEMYLFTATVEDDIEAMDDDIKMAINEGS
ncbi:hypothetical protein DYB35_009131 [Aphanomyces astaci]|uniref:Uncharacterized protein n=1 Tax=Aphanomyces astaci TaxID=112090 RepID=A0A418D031_APHAT|nr:hypothetical protein DYB35_009131 [Aphanomyces astaci]